jgi:hypothetical protein
VAVGDEVVLAELRRFRLRLSPSRPLVSPIVVSNHHSSYTSRMGSRYLLFLLVGLYPASFFASLNWYTFNSNQLLSLLVGVSLGSLALLSLLDLVIWGVGGVVARMVPALRDPTVLGRIRTSFQAAAALIVCGILSRRTLATLPIPVVLSWVTAALLLAGASWHSYARGLRTLNGLFLLLLLATAGQWTQSYLSVTAQLRGDHWYNGARALSEEVTFSKTPNVYYIITESYPNKAALQTFHGIDNAKFYKKVEARGFTLFHDAFSNYSATVTSLASVFAMSHHFGRIAIGELDSFSARDLISARIFNAVVETFKRNGYFVQYVHQSNYQLRGGASLDYYWPLETASGAVESFLEAGDMNRKSALGAEQPNFKAVLKERLAVIRDSERPHFTYIYLKLPNHSPHMRTKSQQNLQRMAKWRRDYRSKHARSNLAVLHTADQILASDKDALIIVSGDHGSWAIRLFLMDDGRPAPDNLVSLDRLGIFLAIRFPPPYDGAFDGSTLSGVNLFRYVFAYLSGSEDVLATRVPDDGYLSSEIDRTHWVRGIEDGRILDTFSELEEE